MRKIHREIQGEGDEHSIFLLELSVKSRSKRPDIADKLFEASFWITKIQNEYENLADKIDRLEQLMQPAYNKFDEMRETIKQKDEEIRQLKINS